MLTFVIKILFILSFNTFLICSPNDLIKQKKYADSLFISEKYFDAITEYKRLIFFDNDNTFKYYSLNQIAFCYKYGGKLENAYNYFSLALTEAKSIREIFDCKINLCRLNIIEQKTKNSHRILDEMERDSMFFEFSSELKYWRAWTFFFEKDYQKASQNFYELNHIDLYTLSKKNYEESFSLTKARVLSAILPGAGQIYSGEYLSGIGSFIWNFISAYLTITAFANERIFDGIVLSNLLWLRFYRGNLENAEKFVEIRNQMIFDKSLTFIFKNYRDKIP